MFLEDVYDEELGAGGSKKKRKKIGKKIGKAFKAVATGGFSLAADTKAGKKAQKKLGKVGKAILTGGISLAVDAAKKKKNRKKIGSAVKSAAKAVIERVKSKPAGSCTCQNDLAKTVAAKLVAELGPPLNAANRALAKFELQRKATYEHKKLMNDSDFRRKVLTFIATKAACGNKSAQRTITCLRG